MSLPYHSYAKLMLFTLPYVAILNVIFQKLWCVHIDSCIIFFECMLNLVIPMFSIEMVDESPPTVKLHFEPKGKPHEDCKFYLAQKEDRCVVCGEEKNFIRKHVIPLEYHKLVYMLCVCVCVCVCTVCARECVW